MAVVNPSTDSELKTMSDPPFGTVRTDLEFPELLRIAVASGVPLRCGRCPHEFRATDTTSSHECKQTLYDQEKYEIVPLDRPLGLELFFKMMASECGTKR